MIFIIITRLPRADSSRGKMDRQKDETIIRQGPIKHKDTTIRFSLVSLPHKLVYVGFYEFQ